MAARRHRSLTMRVITPITQCSCLVGVVIGAFGIFYYKRASSDAESAKALETVYLGIPFFGAGLVIYFIGLWWDRLTARAETSGEIWMRWTCPPEDAKRFLDSERQRLQITSRGVERSATVMAFLLGLAVGIVSVLATSQRSNPYFLTLGPLGMGVFFVLVNPILTRLEFKRSDLVVQSEIRVRSSGLFACETYYPWRSANWALRSVRLEPGDPAVIEFAFWTGRLANYSPPQGGIYSIRAPVPKALEDDAKKLISRFKQDDEGVTVEVSKTVTNDHRDSANFAPDLW